MCRGFHFCFLFPPTAHPSREVYASWRVRRRGKAFSCCELYAAWNAPPSWRHRFCTAVQLLGAARRQKRRRHSTPSRARRVVLFFPFVPPAMRRHVACSGSPHRAARSARARAAPAPRPSPTPTPTSVLDSPLYPASARTNHEEPSLLPTTEVFDRRRLSKGTPVLAHPRR